MTHLKILGVTLTAPTNIIEKHCAVERMCNTKILITMSTMPTCVRNGSLNVPTEVANLEYWRSTYPSSMTPCICLRACWNRAVNEAMYPSDDSTKYESAGK
mmetsp:Transcript_2645/g.3972  ORF Transcript_2645/g.3972 Transcript_2645/m.3972 type:complete len:101 (+) Transcript_2645:823-1125(+)